jgi:hypothetical protein
MWNVECGKPISTAELQGSEKFISKSAGGGAVGAFRAAIANRDFAEAAFGISRRSANLNR